MERRGALGSARSYMLQGGILKEVGTERAGLLCRPQGVIRERTKSLCYRLLILIVKGVYCRLISFHVTVDFLFLLFSPPSLI